MNTYKGKRVPEMIKVGGSPVERQTNLCNMVWEIHHCDSQCYDCIFDAKHLETFEQWEKDNSKPTIEVNGN